MLDAGELGCVDASEAASAWSRMFEGTCLGGEASQSFIENKLDVIEVLRLCTPRVEIHNVRMLRVHDDEHAVHVSAQKQTIVLRKIDLSTC